MAPKSPPKSFRELLDRYGRGERDFSEAADLDTDPDHDLSGVYLDGVDLSSSFVIAIFRGASLRGACFHTANVKCCDFREADLRDADFTGALLCSADFEGANLEGARFTGASIHSYVFPEGEQPDTGPARPNGAPAVEEPATSGPSIDAEARWPDEKIRSIALGYIRQHSMDVAAWRWTRLAEAHVEVLARVTLQAGELSIVSYFHSEEAWYLLTSRRILGSYSGSDVEVPVHDVIDDRFGEFKGIGGRETEVMTLRSATGSEVRLEYETAAASMAPIYYLMFWKRKYPVLHKLKHEPEGPS